NPAHHQAARERVTEIVPAKVSDAGPLEGGCEHAKDKVVRIAGPGAVRDGENVGNAAATLQRSTDGPDFGLHRDVACPTGLRVSDGEDVGREVDVVPAQAEELAASEARVERERHDRPVGLTSLSTKAYLQRRRRTAGHRPGDSRSHAAEATRADARGIRGERQP